MTNLDTSDDADRYIQEHGVESLRRMLDNRQLAGKRQLNAEVAVARHDALQLQREQAERDGLAERMTIAAEAQANDTRRAADAAETSAAAAVEAAGHAKTAWMVAIVAALIAFGALVVAIVNK
ncbi:hypothetical protein [Ralstonia pickettii]|uniref:hypothetical protein n=1 Tax=Ralstonia pickettii TaxID=329 RepID=UPI0004689380|nr:hypothetical protein [Ralstonia pickettii]